MIENDDNIKSFLGATFSDYSLEVKQEEWTGINYKLDKQNFYKFSFYKFNIYYFSAICLTTLLSAYLTIDSFLVPDKNKDLNSKIEQIIITDTVRVTDTIIKSNNVISNFKRAERITTQFNNRIESKQHTNLLLLTDTISSQKTQPENISNELKPVNEAPGKKTVIIRRNVIKRDTVYINKNNTQRDILDNEY